jgi:hypothetical protein
MEEVEKKTKIILFRSQAKVIERYCYSPKKCDSGWWSEDTLTKVINEALKGIEFQYAQAQWHGSNGNGWFYIITYWERNSYTEIQKELIKKQVPPSGGKQMQLLKKILFWFNPWKHLVSVGDSLLLGFMIYPAFFMQQPYQLSDYSLFWNLILTVCIFFFGRFIYMAMETTYYGTGRYEEPPSFELMEESEETKNIKKFLKKLIFLK